MGAEPPADVMTAFGVSGAGRPLPGGGGACWQVGQVVFKPGQHPRVASWSAEVLAGLDGPGFRVPGPVRAGDGSWVVDGWAAWSWVEGEPDPVGRWAELVAACRAFHAALAGTGAPRWLGRGRSHWAVADRVAWGETEVEVAPELADLVGALMAAARPVRSPGQLIHGDIAGNVLFAAGQPPAVIDFSPFWRPAGYALAIAAVDVLMWSGAPPAILEQLAGQPEIDQLLLRAVVFRLVTESIGRPDPGPRDAVRRSGEPVAELVLSRLPGTAPAMRFAGDPDIARLVASPRGRPGGVPRLGAMPNPWDAVAASPQRLLRLGLCSAEWLELTWTCCARRLMPRGQRETA